MGSVSATKAYIDKLSRMFNSMPAPQMVISPSGSDKEGGRYYFEDVGGFGKEGGNPVSENASAALRKLNSSVSLDFREQGVGSYITDASDVKGFITWGYNGGRGGNYANDGSIKFRGDSDWYLMQTVESFDGQRTTHQGNFVDWFSANAFGGTNYENTPVAAVTHVEEPMLVGVHGRDLFRIWEEGQLFADAAWGSHGRPVMMEVGDPLVSTVPILSTSPLNRPPTMDPINDVVLSENAGAQTVNVNGLSVGLGESQNLSLSAVSNNTSLIPNPTITYVSPNTTATMQFTPRADVTGTAVITVLARDGQTQNGVTARSFKVIVNSDTPEQATGLAGRWKLDEAAGAAAFNDFSGQNDAVCYASSCPSSGVDGKVGKALSFNSLNNLVIENITNEIIPANNNGWSVSMWVNPSSVFGTKMIVENENYDQNGFRLAILPDTSSAGDRGKLALWATESGGTIDMVSSSGVIQAGNWYNIVMSYDGKSARLFLDGVLIAEDKSGYIYSNQKRLNFGYGQHPTNGYQGLMDDVIIWNRALSDREVLNLYQNYSI